MQKKEDLKLYGFKLKDDDIVNIFNHTDLIGYEKQICLQSDNLSR